jgi:hypothetical protein
MNKEVLVGIHTNPHHNRPATPMIKLSINQQYALHHQAAEVVHMAMEVVNMVMQLNHCDQIGNHFDFSSVNTSLF